MTSIAIICIMVFQPLWSQLHRADLPCALTYALWPEACRPPRKQDQGGHWLGDGWPVDLYYGDDLLHLPFSSEPLRLHSVANVPLTVRLRSRSSAGT